MDLEQRVRWAEREDKDVDPLDFYNANYEGLTRGQLAEEDPGLYQRLRRDDLLENNVPTKIAPRRTFEDPLAYYNEHYKGFTIRHLQNADFGLYRRLKRDDLLEENVPLGKRGRKSKYGDNPLAYYHKHYEGFTRGQLREAYPGLYDRLRRDDLLDEIPLIKSKYGDDPLAYYRDHYKDFTRGQLANADGGLYKKLSRGDLLGKIPLRRSKYGDDPIAYYYEHHEGLTRWQLQKEASGLYQRLRKDDLLENNVPLGKKGRKPKYGDDPVAYYHEHYEGLTRRELKRVNLGLYQSLCRAKSLSEIPTE